MNLLLHLYCFLNQRQSRVWIGHQQVYCFLYILNIISLSKHALNSAPCAEVFLEKTEIQFLCIKMKEYRVCLVVDVRLVML
jgi:hypothetical protein